MRPPVIDIEKLKKSMAEMRDRNLRALNRLVDKMQCEDTPAKILLLTKEGYDECLDLEDFNYWPIYGF